MKPSGKFILSLTLLGAAILATPQFVIADDCRSAPAPGIDWQNCDKKLLMLGSSDLAAAKLAGADFTATDLRNALLHGAGLEKARLVRAMLSGASANKTNFARVEAYRTDFSGMKATEASFESAELQRSNFRDAKLNKANFTKADLGRSDFQGADIGGSRFALANLSRADFRGAVFSAPVDFGRAFFFLARLEDADLSAATGLSQWQLDQACGNDGTKLPDGLTKPKNWPCLFEPD
jgi:uncharacterized protein YjbI with pentapeptide repeats